MNDEDVFEEVILWLRDITGLTVIKAREGARRPPQPYLMVDDIDQRNLYERPRTILYENTSNKTEEGFDEVFARAIMECEWQFSVHSYGNNPRGPLRLIRAAVEIGQKRERLHPLVAHDLGAINQNDEFINKRWEQRAQAPLFIRGVTEDGFVVDVIEEAPIEVERL